MTVTEDGNGLILSKDGKTLYLTKQEILNAFRPVNKVGKSEIKKIYLAIPYTGMEESSYEQSTKITSILINKGFNVFSPITHSHPLTKYGVKGTWEYWQQIDFQFIDWANEVWVVIPKEGFTKVLSSTGVISEINYAKNTNKPVRYLNEEGEELYE